MAVDRVVTRIAILRSRWVVALGALAVVVAALVFLREDVDLAGLAERAGIPWPSSSEPEAPALDAAVEVRQLLSDETLAIPAVACAQRLLDRAAVPLGLAVDDERGLLVWTEYARGRIRRARLDGSEVEDVATELDGPVGIALDPSRSRIFFTTDDRYPRSVASIAYDGTDWHDVAWGVDVNRPAAIAWSASDLSVYWSESVAGRIRRATLDGSAAEDLVSSGISSIAESSDVEEIRAQGLAVDAAASTLYWTDLASGLVQTAAAPQWEPRTLVATDVRSPDGLAVDWQAGWLYWTDGVSGTIRRVRLDGSEVQDVVVRSAATYAPRALALSAKSQRLYWIDAVAGAIFGADLDGSNPERVVLLDEPAELPDSACARTLAEAGERFVRQSLVLVEGCLQHVSTLKAVKRRMNEAERAAPACLDSMLGLGVGADSPRAILLAELARACPQQDAPLPDPLAICATAPGERSFARCDGTTAGGWTECALSAYKSVAAGAVLITSPRAHEWLGEVRPFLAIEPSVPQTRREVALATLDALRTRLADFEPPSAGVGGRIGATGQLSVYAADREDDTPGGVRVRDDGSVRAGLPRRYRDNGDGTITDLATGLMWEKKCSGCSGLHDAAAKYLHEERSDAYHIRMWLAEINAEGGDGFAGHSDWRIPTAEELLGIVDFERFNPAVSEVFANPQCALGCSDLTDAECSCTWMGPYWSSNAYAESETRSLVVSFHLGLVGEREHSEALHVRAVRGGANGD